MYTIRYAWSIQIIMNKRVKVLKIKSNERIKYREASSV